MPQCSKCPAPAAPGRDRCERHLRLARERSHYKRVRKAKADRPWRPK